MHFAILVHLIVTLDLYFILSYYNRNRQDRWTEKKKKKEIKVEEKVNRGRGRDRENTENLCREAAVVFGCIRIQCYFCKHMHR